MLANAELASRDLETNAVYLQAVGISTGGSL